MEYILLLSGLAIGLLVAVLVWLGSARKSEFDLLKNQIQDTKNLNQNLLEKKEYLEKELLAAQISGNQKSEDIKQFIAENSSLKTSLDGLTLHYNRLMEEVNLQKGTNIQQQTDILNLQKAISRQGSENQFLLEKLNTQKLEFEEMRKQSQVEFQNIANKILDEKTQKFTNTNKEQIDLILKPLGINLDEFKKKVEETYDKESKQRFSLEERVKELIELNNRLSQEANNLTSALKGQSKKQGNWGEIILESILEKSGLQRNREYEVQATLYDESGKQLRPDMLVHLPESRTIIIDSKVSLVAYDRYCASDIKEVQDIALKEHIESIYKHVDDLSRKKYDTLVQTLDFTMMFIPIEPAYLVAIQEDPELWAYAYAKRILLISPTNLITALKLVADLWKRESQNQNAREIARQGEKLFEKFVGFAESLEDIGKHLNRSQESYHKAVGQLKDGKGNLVSQAMKLSKLGLNSEKEIPPTFMPLSDTDEENPEE